MSSFEKPEKDQRKVSPEVCCCCCFVITYGWRLVSSSQPASSVGGAFQALSADESFGTSGSLRESKKHHAIIDCLDKDARSSASGEARLLISTPSREERRHRTPIPSREREPPRSNSKRAARYAAQLPSLVDRMRHCPRVTQLK